MKLVIQRVESAKVLVNRQVCGEIEQGYLVYLAVHRDDSEQDIDWIVNRLLKIKLFGDEQGKMGKTLQEVQGDLLVVSQFTLYGTLKKGTKPSFSLSAPGDKAECFYQSFLDVLKKNFLGKVATGKFAADMKVHSVNDGPVTLILDSLAKD